MKSTTLLLEDHKHLLKALRMLEGVSALADQGHQVDRNDVAGLLEFLEGFGDRIHQGREEGIFFPALLRDRGQKHYSELCALIFEHNRHRSLLEGLHDSMEAGANKEFVFYANRLVDVMRRHIQEEEEKLFPLADASLSEADDEITFREMKAEDKEWYEKNVPRLLGQLEEMEKSRSH